MFTHPLFVINAIGAVICVAIYIFVRYSLTARYILWLNRDEAQLCQTEGYKPMAEPYQLRNATIFLCVWMYFALCSIGALVLMLQNGTLIPTATALQQPEVAIVYVLALAHWGGWGVTTWLLPRMRYSIRWNAYTIDF